MRASVHRRDADRIQSRLHLLQVTACDGRVIDLEIGRAEERGQEEPAKAHTSILPLALGDERRAAAATDCRALAVVL